MFCVSFTEILDYVKRALSSMGKSTDSMVVLNQRDYCLAAELMVVPILQSGPSPSFLHSAVFQYLSPGNLSSVIHESTLKGAALKVNKWISDFAIVFKGGTKYLSVMIHLMNSLVSF